MVDINKNLFLNKNSFNETILYLKKRKGGKGNKRKFHSMIKTSNCQSKILVKENITRKRNYVSEYHSILIHELYFVWLVFKWENMVKDFLLFKLFCLTE